MKLICMLFVFLLSFGVYAEPKKVWVGEFEIAYDITGKGEHIVLLEGGAFGTIDDWNFITDNIKQSATVVRYARVGNGHSTQIRRHFMAEDFAGHLSQLLKTINITKPVIYVAHSYGGTVARVFAANYPDQVKALLLVDPSSEHDVDIIRQIDFEKGNKEIEQIKANDAKNHLSNHYLDFWSKRPLPDYPQIKDVPVTVIATIKHVENPANLFMTDKGRELWGKLHTEWAESFPRGKAVLTKNSGHLIPQEEPELVIKEILEMLKKVD